MPQNLDELVKRAMAVKMSAEDAEKQRRSFAYGNTKIENERITRDSVNQAAEKLASGNAPRV